MRSTNFQRLVTKRLAEGLDGVALDEITVEFCRARPKSVLQNIEWLINVSKHENFDDGEVKGFRALNPIFSVVLSHTKDVSFEEQNIQIKVVPNKQIGTTYAEVVTALISDYKAQVISAIGPAANDYLKAGV